MRFTEDGCKRALTFKQKRAVKKKKEEKYKNPKVYRKRKENA